VGIKCKRPEQGHEYRLWVVVQSARSTSITVFGTIVYDSGKKMGKKRVMGS
jgi:hypothetical protein